SLKRVTRAPHGGGLLAIYSVAYVSCGRWPMATVIGTFGTLVLAVRALTLAPSRCETPQDTHATLAVPCF
ncbi:MAG: hypothetical protein AAB899_01260, partial [Patescibacteria group bacterium]